MNNNEQIEWQRSVIREEYLDLVDIEVGQAVSDNKQIGLNKPVQKAGE